MDTLEKNIFKWNDNRRAFLKATLLVGAAIPIAATLKFVTNPPHTNRPQSKEAEFYRRIE